MTCSTSKVREDGKARGQRTERARRKRKRDVEVEVARAKNDEVRRRSWWVRRKTHVRSSGCDGCRVQGSVGREGFEDHQVVGSVELVEKGGKEKVSFSSSSFRFVSSALSLLPWTSNLPLLPP